MKWGRPWMNLFVVAFLSFAAAVAKPMEDDAAIRQRIPVKIREGEPLVFNIDSLSGNGVNDVGIECSDHAWKVMTGKNAKPINVRLKSSSMPGVKIGKYDVSGGGRLFREKTPGIHYLFCLRGKPGTSASIEITFDSAPHGSTVAEMVVSKTRQDN